MILNIVCFSLTGAPRTAITDRSTELNTKMSNLFSGTQDKCIACDNKVYPLEKVLIVIIYQWFSSKKCWWIYVSCCVGSSWWEAVPQGLFQVQPRQVCDKPFELRCTRATHLLQASPRAALHAEGQLQQIGQIRSIYRGKWDATELASRRRPDWSYTNGLRSRNSSMRHLLVVFLHYILQNFS